MSHTPGKLTLHEDHYSDQSVITDSDGFQIVEVSHMPVLLDYAKKLGIDHWTDKPGEAYKELSEEEQRANARRVVACWNACEAISTESLETELSTVTAWSRTATSLIATMTQRDDLLEALKQARLYVAGEAVPTKAHALEIIDAAIAKVQL